MNQVQYGIQCQISITLAHINLWYTSMVPMDYWPAISWRWSEGWGCDNGWEMPHEMNDSVPPYANPQHSTLCHHIEGNSQVFGDWMDPLKAQMQGARSSMMLKNSALYVLALYQKFTVGHRYREFWLAQKSFENPKQGMNEPCSNIICSYLMLCRSLQPDLFFSTRYGDTYKLMNALPLPPIDYWIPLIKGFSKSRAYH